MLIAITRQISPRFSECELTHLARQPIDLDRAHAQHHAYEAALRELGCEVISLPAEPDLPDSVFVEDVALVFDELAIVTRPGADSRKPETESIARALLPHRSVHRIEPPGTIDGGDVLLIGRDVYVGRSSRSNASGEEQLRRILAPHGYRVRPVEVTGCLHLKSAVTQVRDDTLLINPAWVDPSCFDLPNLIEVAAGEPSAANALWIERSVIYPSNFPKTRQRLERAGLRLRILAVSELAKAEGAVTCCSLIFQAGTSRTNREVKLGHAS